MSRVLADCSGLWCVCLMSFCRLVCVSVCEILSQRGRVHDCLLMCLPFAYGVISDAAVLARCFPAFRLLFEVFGCWW